MTNERDFDLRLVGRSTRRGAAETDAYKKHLESLEDVADNAGVVEVQFERSDEESEEIADEQS